MQILLTCLGRSTVLAQLHIKLQHDYCDPAKLIETRPVLRIWTALSAQTLTLTTISVGFASSSQTENIPAERLLKKSLIICDQYFPTI